jgi:hypothetical protein
MTYKICHVIFSTNRIEYLTKTLESTKLIDFSNCEVDRIFIDDFPKGRNDRLLELLVRSYGFNEIYLHKENMGLSVTWTECWNLLKERNYDYIWHMEDDVEIVEPFKITDLVDLLNNDSSICAAKLERQAWYWHESDPVATYNDSIFRHFRYTKGQPIFSPMATLYSSKYLHFNYSNFYKNRYPDTNWWTINFNEGMIGKALNEEFGVTPAIVKTSEGKNYIKHIGEYFVGKRVLPHEPHYDWFEKYDPEKKYYSTTGDEYPE